MNERDLVDDSEPRAEATTEREHTAQLDAMTKERDDLRASHISLMRVSGVLVDSGDVPLPGDSRLDEAVAMIVRQRDEEREGTLVLKRELALAEKVVEAAQPWRQERYSGFHTAPTQALLDSLAAFDAAKGER